MPFGIYGSRCMEPIEQLAQAALERDHLKLRSLVQDFARAKTDFGKLPRPSTTDARLLVISAALTELLAQRNNQTPPETISIYAPPDKMIYSSHEILLGSAKSLQQPS